MKTLRMVLAAAFAAIALAGCGVHTLGPAPATEVVLQGFLHDGAPIADVELRKTIPADQYYSWMPLDPYAISGATVVITHSGVRDTLAELSNGRYGDSSLVAHENETYSVDVTFPADHEFAGHHLTAVTTVPARVHADVTINPQQLERQPGIMTVDTLVFPKEIAYPDSFGTTDANRPFSLAWNDAAGAYGYIFGTIAQDTVGTGLLRKRNYDDWKKGKLWNPADRQNYERSGTFALPDSLHSDVFWLMFSYQGPTDVLVVAADKSYFTYFQTSVQWGMTGNDYDVGTIGNVKGGLGIFGSYEADTVRTYVIPEWLPSAHDTQP